MESESFDVVIIGGGINGTSAARDAALRGLTVALVEKHDFGWGTTAASTRLIHGGLRYLELMDFALVREALREREVLLRQAPHLVRPLPFMVPIYRNSRRGPFAVKVGMILYDLLSYDKSLPSHRWCSRNKLLELEPRLNADGLRGGAVYYDAQVSFPERLCVDHARDAAAHGARLANYAEVISIERDPAAHDPRGTAGAGTGARAAMAKGSYTVRVRDRLRGSEHALTCNIVLNAAGPWADSVPAPSPKLRKTKGVHLVVPSFTRHAIVQIAESDGRVFFAIPWERYTLVGTTDTDYRGDPGNATADADDLTYLLRETRRYFPGVALDTVYLTMAGVRPLVRALPGTSESQVSRKHLIADSDPGKAHGVVSILGGKITNHRATVEEAVDVVCKKLGVDVRARTRQTPLIGGAFEPGVTVQKAAEAWAKEYAAVGVPVGTVRHLAMLYGSETPQLLELCVRDSRLARPLVHGRPDIAAQVVFGVEHEMCRRSMDFVLRRSGMGLHPHGLDAESAVREVLVEHIGWDTAEIEADRVQAAFEASRLRVPALESTS